MSTVMKRRLPVGAETSGEGTHFRVWAPHHTSVQVITDSARVIPLAPEPGGYFSGFDGRSRAGTLYQYRLDGSDRLLPDPASRFQPEGPHGPSQIVDAASFQWKCRDWRGVRIEDQVMYEMHIGTFTAEGTWQSAESHLPELRDTGITLLEIMPVADFVGKFGWGYDGVSLFAPTALYGTPDDFRRFIDAAHGLGLGVILDVVYNHFGPDGNTMKHFSPSYFTDRYENEWGEAINFDGPESEQVREFFLSNAAYWIEEFQLDGLRLDATQQIFDSSPRHIIAEIAARARQSAGNRKIVIIGENERQDSTLVRPASQGGYTLDALWNDDFHHTASVALNGRREAYYYDYTGTPQEFISSMKWGYLYQGQYYYWQKQSRGTPALDLKPAMFINYLQNHDQVANSGTSERLHTQTSPARLRTLTALLLLGPQTPMLFQGQEFAASSPFYYFADHRPELASRVQEGRIEFLRQFPSVARTPIKIAAAAERSTFESSKLDHSERKKNARVLALHRDLIRLRREDPVFSAQRSDWMHGAVLGPQVFAIRFLAGELEDRLIIVNLGPDLRLEPAPEPLLAPPHHSVWTTMWFSEDPRYGGCGKPPLDESGIWSLTSESLAVLKSKKTKSD